MTEIKKQLAPDHWAQNLGIFEIKQLADKEAIYKERCREAIFNYRNWQRSQRDQTDMIEMLYGGMEGKMHRNQVSDSVTIYWAVRKHFRTAFSKYLEKTGCYPANNYYKKIKA